MQQRAFTLVELSIVLVILGLLVGGVLSGQSLIHAAELRKVTRDLNSYETALNSFRDKYFALPGDMINATSYWGITAGSTGSDSTCGNASSTGIATCNGDGDGSILFSTTSTSVQEAYRAWQHLANAGLVEGNYTGVRTSGTVAGTPRTNVPPAAVSNGVYSFIGAAVLIGDTTRILVLGSATTFTASISRLSVYTNWGGALKMEDAYNLDMKMDDGTPSTGRVRTNFYNSTCAPYVLSDTTTLCALGYYF